MTKDNGSINGGNLKRLATLLTGLVILLSSGCAGLQFPAHISPSEPAVSDPSARLDLQVPRDESRPEADLAPHKAATALGRFQPSYFSKPPQSGIVIRAQSPDRDAFDLSQPQIFLDVEAFEKNDSPPKSSPWMESLQEVTSERLGTPLSAWWQDVKADHGNFYSIDNLPTAAVLLGTGAWLANSDLDQNILEHVQDNITFNDRTNEYQEFVGEFKFFGEGYFLLPIYAGSAILGKQVFGDSPRGQRIGEWGDRNLRSVVIGAPVLVVSQLVLGGSRPGESPEAAEGSEWQFFEDNNGVSGHAFMGAIPFLTAFHMARDRKWKALYFAASTLPALSRITENGHYPSQALLGWGLAWLATKSVDRTGQDSLLVAPYMSPEGLGIGVTLKR